MTPFICGAYPVYLLCQVAHLDATGHLFGREPIPADESKKVRDHLESCEPCGRWYRNAIKVYQSGAVEE